MRSLRVPGGVWTWRGTSLVLVLILVPLGAALGLGPDVDVVASSAGALNLVIGTALVAGAVFLYLHWRITSSEPSGWVTLVLAWAAVPRLAMGGFSLTHAELAERQTSWLLLFRVVLVLLLTGTVLISRRVRLRVDPLAAGLLAGLAYAGVRHLVLLKAAPLGSSSADDPMVILLRGLFALGLGIAVLQLVELPAWIRYRVAAGLTLLGVGSAVTDAVGLVLVLVGAVLMAGTGAAALYDAIDDEKRTVAALHERLESVEVGLREDRALLHEIDATVAGIASAQQLIHDAPPHERDEDLRAMVRAEVERLQRLASHRTPNRRRTVDLDEIVGQIVLAHTARGRQVRWEPSGLRALGRADDIAEVVNVLLENAFVHGGPGPVTVEAATGPADEDVTVTVSDRGPGVAPGLRDRLFDWGVSRPGSPGQGIGLHAAAEIARDLQGRLELLPTAEGAAFALHLPVARAEVSTPGVARTK